MMERPFPAYQGDEPYVFVSYSHADIDLVYPELARLNAQGFNIWYDEGISPGTVWRDELARAIENCSVFLLYVSEGTNSSEHCMKELNFALDAERGLLAVHLDTSELSAGLRLSLSDRQAIIKHELSEAAYHEMLDEALRGQLPASRAPVVAVPAPPTRGRSNGLRIGLATAAVVLIGVVAWLATDRQMAPPTYDVEANTVSFADRPAIAVLPFKNMSGNPDDAYFVDGLTEDLIDRLASWRQFPVIGSFSSAGYRDDSAEPRQIALELGARYLVRGSARRTKDAVRVNVRLYDANSAVQIWSQRYERPFDDVLTAQDEISTAVVGQMYAELHQFDRQRAMRRNPDDMNAWDLTQRGWWYFSKGGRADNLQARESYRQAGERDSSYATAAAGLALTHYRSVSSGWSDAPEESIELLVQAAERSVVLDHVDPLSQHALGHAYALSGNREGMIEAFNTSLELNPSSALVAICAGEGLAMAGESDAAIKVLDTAMWLSPKDPLVYWAYNAMAMAHFGEERDDEAASWARRALSHNPEFAFGYRTLATSLAHAGQLDAAREALARATGIEPNFTYAGGRRVLLTGSPEFAERYMDGLRMAGLE